MRAQESSDAGNNLSTDELLAFVRKIAENAVEAVGNNASVGGHIPANLKQRIDKWKFGAYGWTSPVNLLITAAWVKALFPSQDVCMIWAKDGEGRPISGGYSIRTLDEKVTVPMVSRFDIWPDFCSNNSGMQGSRALEKARGASRIERNTSLAQKVVFDLSLFANIINDINELDVETSRAACQYLFEIGFHVKCKRDATLKALKASGTKHQANVIGFALAACNSMGDPQFVRAVVAAILVLMVKHHTVFHGSILKGIESKKTGADTQTRGPGDLWIESDEIPSLAVEVKDQSKTFDFAVLSAVKARLNNNPAVKTYFMITAAETAISSHVAGDAQWNKQLDEIRETFGCAVVVMTLRDFLGLSACLLPLEKELLNEISACLGIAPDLKKETLAAWVKMIAG